MNTLDELRVKVHTQLLKMRSLDRILNSIEFIKTYATSTEIAQGQAIVLITQSNAEGLSDWVEKQKGDEHANLTSRELRKVAQRLGVPFYSTLPKASLLSEITNYEKVKSRRACKLACVTS